MKRALLLLALLLPLAAHSGRAPSLKENMKAIEKIVKLLENTVGDKNQNSASAIQAHKLAEIFTATVSQIPDKIKKLPPREQAAAIADYKRMIQDEIGDAQRLETAFRTNDNGAASRILDDIMSGKREGHRRFK